MGYGSGKSTTIPYVKLGGQVQEFDFAKLDRVAFRLEGDRARRECFGSMLFDKLPSVGLTVIQFWFVVFQDDFSFHYVTNYLVPPHFHFGRYPLVAVIGL